MRSAALTKPRYEDASAPAIQTNPSRVRPLGLNDLEEVARLFLRRFRKGAKSPRALEEVAQSLKALYLDVPGLKGDSDALVVEAPGAIAAFCGGVRMPFRFDGRLVSACVSGTLMASDAPGHALAAVQILRYSRKADYDLIVTDSANRASLAVCQAMGYRVVSPDSLEWACLFQPASVGLHKLRQRIGGSALGLLAPLARVADKAAGAILRRAEAAGKPSDWRDEEVDDETFADIAPRFADGYRLRPDYSREKLLWTLRMARQRQAAGPLSLRLIYAPDGTPAGAYAAFGGRDEVARIFHSVAAPHAWSRLFAAMRETARARGCIGAHGPVKPPMLAHAYAQRGVFFYYAGGMLVYSNRPEIQTAIERGEALLGGLAGDRWTRLASDSFG